MDGHARFFRPQDQADRVHRRDLRHPPAQDLHEHRALHGDAAHLVRDHPRHLHLLRRRLRRDGLDRSEGARREVSAYAKSDRTIHTKSASSTSVPSVNTMNRTVMMLAVAWISEWTMRIAT